MASAAGARSVLGTADARVFPTALLTQPTLRGSRMRRRWLRPGPNERGRSPPAERSTGSVDLVRLFLADGLDQIVADRYTERALETDHPEVGPHPEQDSCCVGTVSRSGHINAGPLIAHLQVRVEFVRGTGDKLVDRLLVDVLAVRRRERNDRYIDAGVAALEGNRDAGLTVRRRQRRTSCVAGKFAVGDH